MSAGAGTQMVTRRSLFDAELVSFGVRQHNPATRRQRPTVINNGRSESNHPVNFVILVMVDREDIEMDSILHDLSFRHHHKYKTRPSAVGRSHDPVIVARRLHFLENMSGDGAPELGHDRRLMTVKGHVQDG